MIRLSLSATLLGACVFSAPALAANPPANMCVELTAWIEQTNKVGGQKPADTASVPASQAPADPKTATAVEAHKGGSTPAPGGQDSVQQDSGMSGPVRKDGPGAAGPQGAAQERAKSGEANPKPDARAAAAPTAAPDPKAPPASPQAIEKVRQSAGANDLDACAAVAREMRLAGVALPNPIIALAALKPEIRNTAPKGPAPGVPPIPPSGVNTPATGQSPDQASPQPAPATR